MIKAIAMGLTLRRLAGKVVMSKIRSDCEKLLSNHQLGVGMPRGAETAVRMHYEGT